MDLIRHDELRDSARRVLDRHRDRKAASSDLWSTIAEQGWLGLAVAEEAGGLGQPFSALAVLYQELGRVLAEAPFLSASLSLDALSRADAAQLLEQAIAGKAIVAPVMPGAGLVLDAGIATHLLVPIEDDAPAIALIALPHPGVSITSRPTWDKTRRIFDVAFEKAAIGRDAILLQGDAAAAALRRMAAHFDLALACDAVGGAEAIFTQTLDYMNTRHQFNRAIASFQALKHRCADLKVAMEAARALVEAACRSFSEERGDWRAMAACARLQAGAAYRIVTEEAVQLHGGIGFTWEHDCHLYLKRARLNDVLGGSAEQRKDAVAPVLFSAARERKNG